MTLRKKGISEHGDGEEEGGGGVLVMGVLNVDGGDGEGVEDDEEMRANRRLGLLRRFREFSGRGFSHFRLLG